MLTRGSDMGHLLPRVERFGIDSTTRMRTRDMGRGPGEISGHGKLLAHAQQLQQAPNKIFILLDTGRTTVQINHSPIHGWATKDDRNLIHCRKNGEIHDSTFEERDHERAGRHHCGSLTALLPRGRTSKHPDQRSAFRRNAEPLRHEVERLGATRSHHKHQTHLGDSTGELVERPASLTGCRVAPAGGCTYEGVAEQSDGLTCIPASNRAVHAARSARLDIHDLRMRRLLYFGIDSRWRLLGRRRGCVGLGVGQLGPDVLPVVGAQVTASDLSVGHALDGDTVGSTWQPTVIPVDPLTQLNSTHSAPHLRSSQTIDQLSNGHPVR